jgi:hypothetical protein
MSVFGGPNIIEDSLLLCLDAGNTKSYPETGATWTDISRNGRDFNLTAPFPATYSFEASSRSLKFTRSMPPASEAGAYADITVSGNLAVSTYLYNNHTTEVWARINNASPTNYDATEFLSALLVYRGYHAMFFYTATNLAYEIWNGTASTVSAPTASISSSNANIIVGTWFHVVVVRSGNTFTTFINGVPIGTNSFTAPNAAGIGTTNNLRIAIASNNGQTYTWNADCNVSTVRMYNRALAATEVLQNYNATKGRFRL